jgi:N6-adenosine-specific RNA methylase IME4
MLKVKTLSKIAFSVVLLGVTMMSTSGQALEVKGSDDIQMEIQKTLEYTEQQKDLLDYANKVAKKKSKIELFNVDGVDGVVVLNSTDKGTEVIVKANEEIDIRANAAALFAKKGTELNFDDPWNRPSYEITESDVDHLVVIEDDVESRKDCYYAGSKGVVKVENNGIERTVELKALRNFEKNDELIKEELLAYAKQMAKEKSKIELFNVDGVDGVVVLNSTDEGTQVIVKANEELDIKAEAIILTEKQESILDYENPWNEAYNSVETPDKKSLIVESFKSEFSIPEYYSGRRARVTVKRNRKQKIIDLKILEKEYTNAEESQM